MAKIALLQMTSSPLVEENLGLVAYYCAKAKKAGAELLVLPENFAFMGQQEQDKLDYAETFGQGLIQETLAKLARQFELWLIAGTLPLKANKTKVRASCLVFDSQGFCVARYDKIHLFDVQLKTKESYHESATIEAGQDIVLVDTPVGRIGLTVCYDLRFPELYQSLVAKGAEIFTVPAAFTAVTGAAHWEVLLRARAIETLSYVIAPNQSGFHQNGRHTYGTSMVVDPWGKIIAKQEAGIGLVVTELDLAYLRELRQEFPINQQHVLLN